MNWNGKIDAESPLDRIIQFVTSWRVYATIMVLALGWAIPPMLGFPRTWTTGFFVGATCYMYAQHLIDDAMDLEEE